MYTLLKETQNAVCLIKTIDHFAYLYLYIDIN